MKKLLLFGVLALVVIGCVVAAGCTSTEEVSPDTVMDEPAVLDYSDPENWFCLETNPTKDVDSISFYGTVSGVSDYENGLADITDEVKASVGFKQGNPFEEYTNLYAPYYHQHSLQYAAEVADHDRFMGSIRNSMELDDVTAALDYYFKNYNNGRPFIIWGHSQGGAVVQLIVEHYMKEHPEYYKNMVAAYSVGYGVTQKWLNDNPHAKIAQGEDDTGVIISWNTEGPNATKASMVLGENPVLINPLNWKTDETYADKSLNKGTLVTADDGTQSVVPGLNDAQINRTRGALICTTDTTYEPDASPIISEESFHTRDYALYLANVQENGQKRIQAFLAKNA
ncbi:MAG TPA: DUF3089 domain-containing protein [Methanocorpusculum sp.]|nr:DUF3089 domain-containing protein [Methanocorpusculum sp.]